LIVVCGEALIDLKSTDGVAFTALLGGGPFNTAIAVGRLGSEVAFLSRASTDRFGTRLTAALRDNHVDTSLMQYGSEPTTLAIVDVDERGDAHYSFRVDGTADRQFTVADLPELPDDADLIHFGTLSLVLEPAATAYATLMQRCSRDRVVVVDPNVRPQLVGPRADYVKRFEHWCTLASVVKLSSADAHWLYPDDSMEAIAARVVSLGVGLLAVTDGSRGAHAITAAAGTITAVGETVAVVDTIGAGDTFNAAMMVWLVEHGCRSRSAIEWLDRGALHDMLVFAGHAAAVNCTRAGADPPWRRELTLAE
jgi:fructokinase